MKRSGFIKSLLSAPLLALPEYYILDKKPLQRDGDIIEQTDDYGCQAVKTRVTPYKNHVLYENLDQYDRVESSCLIENSGKEVEYVKNDKGEIFI